MLNHTVLNYFNFIIKSIIATSYRITDYGNQCLSDDPSCIDITEGNFWQ